MVTERVIREFYRPCLGKTPDTRPGGSALPSVAELVSLNPDKSLTLKKIA